MCLVPTCFQDSCDLPPLSECLGISFQPLPCPAPLAQGETEIQPHHIAGEWLPYQNTLHGFKAFLRISVSRVRSDSHSAWVPWSHSSKYLGCLANLSLKTDAEDIGVLGQPISHPITNGSADVSQSHSHPFSLSISKYQFQREPGGCGR